MASVILGIAIVLGVNRVLDMCRSVCNVTDDLIACVNPDHHFKGPTELEEEHLGKVATPAMPGREPHAAD